MAAEVAEIGQQPRPPRRGPPAPAVGPGPVAGARRCLGSAEAVQWGGRPIRAKTYVSVLHAMLWVGLAAVRGLLTEEVSEAEFDVAHPQYTLDGAVAQFAGQGQDIRGDIPKLSVLVVHAVQLASLGGRRPFIAPAADLLGIDFDVVHLLGMHLLHPIEGGVVEYVRPVFCLAQRAEMLARVVQ